MARFCQHADCQRKNKPKRASYGFGKEQKYCGEHKENGMRNPYKKYCEGENMVDGKIIKCDKYPSYNYKRGQLPKYCKTHIPKGEKMINVNKKSCIFVDPKTGKRCELQPSFNLKNEKELLYCSKHADRKKMINKSANLCIKCNKKDATYNYQGEIARYCFGCKEDEMIDTKHFNCQKCNKPNCCFNYEGLYPRFCGNCAEDGMINVRNKKCDFTPTTGEKCKKQALYNILGNLPKFCWSHSDKNTMINVKAKLCTYTYEDGEKCIKYAYYNLIGKTEPIFCPQHYKKGMVTVKRKLTKCIHEECEDRNIAALYGPLFKEKIHCENHKLNNEIRNNNPICEGGKDMPNCTEPPIYATRYLNFPLRCQKHKLLFDSLIEEKMCEKCNQLSLLNKHNKLCNTCGDYKKYHKRKEFEILKLLQNNKIFHYHNKRIYRTLFRPDFYIELDNYYLIIEVDEYRHKDYLLIDDIERMKKIRKKSDRNIIFIRYNPDAYKNDKNEIIRFQTGRKEFLLNLIQQLSHMKDIEEEINVYYLYYDGFNGNPEKIIFDSETSTFDIIRMIKNPELFTIDDY
tara:strand:- start:1671 stop:3380 length:1710 start_codon:yes stop_codon:yes gene_type:complete